MLNQMLERYWQMGAKVTSAFASESEHAAGNRALLIANAIMRDNRATIAGLSFQVISASMLTASQCLRGEGFEVFAKYDVYDFHP